MLLKNQKIIVIGGSRGIGIEITRALGKHGAKLIITGRNQEALEAAKTSIPNIIRTACFDFADEMAVKQFFKTVNEVDHLLLVAGGAPLEGEFLNTDISKIEGYFTQKFWGVVRTAQCGIPVVKPKGSITFFIGRAGRAALSGWSAVAAVNMAIVGLAKTIALEIAPKRVNVIAPGLIDTHVYDSMSAGKRQTYYSDTASNIPAGRIGKPEDVAQCVELLLTCDYVNGIVLDVNGGGTIANM